MSCGVHTPVVNKYKQHSGNPLPTFKRLVAANIQASCRYIILEDTSVDNTAALTQVGLTESRS